MVTATTIAETEANVATEGIAVIVATEGIVETGVNAAIAETGTTGMTETVVIVVIETREVIAETEGTGETGETGENAATAMIAMTTTMMQTSPALVTRDHGRARHVDLKMRSALKRQTLLQAPRQTTLPHKSLLLEVC